MKKKIIPLMVAAALCSVQASAATIEIVPGAGFDDATLSNTISTQRGNNPGNTLGEMRLKVFQEAAKVWGEVLNSTQNIRVGAKFAVLPCGELSATLGSAGPTSTKENFGSGDANIAYAVALAESLSSSNQNGGSTEIEATFNSAVDSDPGCLGGAGFYYGLDDNVPAGLSALFPTVLHEMGHGLGFLSYVNPNGTYLNGTMDPFSRMLRDVGTGKNWEDMSNAERAASSLNEPDLVWRGSQVTTDRGMHLAPEPELRINAPNPVGTYEVLLGQQSVAIPNGGLTADVIDGGTFMDVFGNFSEGCQQIGYANDGLFTGKVVLFNASDDCPVIFQVAWAEYQDAVGVIISDTTGSGLPDMSGLLTPPNIIPYIGVHQSEGAHLRSDIVAANATFQNSASKYIGENQGMVKMYAPPGLVDGSSVSHWSLSASPDLLMKPSLGSLQFKSVDLTAAAFMDIGWSVNIPGANLDLIYGDGFE